MRLNDGYNVNVRNAFERKLGLRKEFIEANISGAVDFEAERHSLPE